MTRSLCSQSLETTVVIVPSTALSEAGRCDQTLPCKARTEVDFLCQSDELVYYWPGQRDLYNLITDNYQAAGWSTDCRVFTRACKNNFLQFNASETSSSLILVIFLQMVDLHRWEIFSEKMARREICYVVGLVLPWSWSWRMQLTSSLSWPWSRSPRNLKLKRCCLSGNYPIFCE